MKKSTSSDVNTSYEKTSRSYDLSPEAVQVLDKITDIKGLTKSDFVSEAIIQYADTVFGSTGDTKEDILDGKMDYLIEIVTETQYEALKSKKPKTVQNISKSIKDINFDVDSMELQILKDAREPKKTSTRDLYTVALAVKYGFHEEE